MAFDGIFIQGARENNLQNIDVRIPRNKITVVTGLSGSGKSSLAFDVLYAEGHRHYMESLSSFTLGSPFIKAFKKPKVDSIVGLSPALALEQKSSRTSPRSSVGTITEINDFLRLLFSHKGLPKCPEHKEVMKKQTEEEIIRSLQRLPAGEMFSVLAPVVEGRKGEFLSDFRRWVQKGITRAKIDGKWIHLEEASKLSRYRSHTIELLLDRLTSEKKFLNRLKRSLKLALSLAKGVIKIEIHGEKPRTQIYSLHTSCPQCGFSFPKIDVSFFSSNHPKGACSTCKGLGVLERSGDREGRRNRENGRDREDHRESLAFVGEEGQVCFACKGARLKKEVLNVFFDGKNISELLSLSAKDLYDFLSSKEQDLISGPILREILIRLRYMLRVGVSYLSMDRPVYTLSGGEMQRVRMATQAGSSLIGITYVLDEPSIGLHSRDMVQLLNVLTEIKEKGNTVFVVEHDRESILHADHVIDLGLGAGRKGGKIVACGLPKEIASHEKSLTGKYLSHRLEISLPKKRRPLSEKRIFLEKASGHNLKNIDVEFPLGVLCAVTGVSGSGKSTLVLDTLYRILARKFGFLSPPPLAFKKVRGLDEIKGVLEVDQKPIGRTSRSIPATYVGLYTFIRELFSKVPEAALRGIGPQFFSFNVKGGRCEFCKGHGVHQIKMSFLQEVFVPCKECHGKRFSLQILDLMYKNRSISDVLNMTVDEALDFFKYHKRIYRKLNVLKKVNLGYLTLGQSSTTLSGGEAQRIKLGKELSKKNTGATFYILDEPTTGLHFEDIKKLIELLQELVRLGNTVVVIEHHLDVIKCSDYIIDLGPEGGPEGGRVVAAGSPEEIVKSNSETGFYLRKML